MASKASGKLPVISFGLTALSALGFAWLARRVWGERSKWRFVYGFTWASTLAMLLTLMAVFPILNTKIVIHHFFDNGSGSIAQPGTVYDIARRSTSSSC